MKNKEAFKIKKFRQTLVDGIADRWIRLIKKMMCSIKVCNPRELGG